MTRDTVSSVTSANAATQVPWSMLVKVALNSSTLYASTGMRFVFDGVNTWSPVGGLGGLEAIREDTTTKSRGLRLWLAAINSSQLYEPFTEALFNKEVRVYRATLSGSNTCVGTPQQAFRGYINKVDVHLGDSERGNYFELECESRIRREASTAYYTREFLMQTYSGDTGLDYVSRIANFQSNWGGKNQVLSGLASGQPAPPVVGRAHGGGNPV
jgi:hypothetical protein